MLSILAAKRRVTQHVSALYILFPWPSAIQPQSFAPCLFLGGIFFQLVPSYFTLPPSRRCRSSAGKQKPARGRLKNSMGRVLERNAESRSAHQRQFLKSFSFFLQIIQSILSTKIIFCQCFLIVTYLLLAALFRKCMLKHWWNSSLWCHEGHWELTVASPMSVTTRPARSAKAWFLNKQTAIKTNKQAVNRGLTDTY